MTRGATLICLWNLSWCRPSRGEASGTVWSPSLRSVPDPQGRSSAFATTNQSPARRVFSGRCTEGKHEQKASRCDTIGFPPPATVSFTLICRFGLLQPGPNSSSARVFVCVCVCLGGSDPPRDPERGGADVFPPSLFTPVRRKTTGRARRVPFVSEQCVYVRWWWEGVVSQRELIGSRGGREPAPQPRPSRPHPAAGSPQVCLCDGRRRRKQAAIIWLEYSLLLIDRQVGRIRCF